MLPDGTIAVVRGSDYHVDWIAPNGAVTSTPKIAHEWLPLTDNMKRAIIDSVRRADSTNLERQRPRADSMALAAGHATCAAGNVASELVCSGSGPIDLPVYMTPEQLPNLSPPFLQYDARGLTYSSSPVRADADGNLWIRVNQGAGGQLAALPKAASGGFVYDIVSRQGVLVDRIQIPAGTTLIGFGRGVAYLVSREGAGYRLARARIH
jgi:hypothetical protein